MHSPMKDNIKKARKPSTFSQPAVQSEVGDFKGGYFVMTDTIASKENEYKSRNNSNNSKQDSRSPSRRKHQTNESNVSSSLNSKERACAPKFEYDVIKKPALPTPLFVEVIKDPIAIKKQQELLTPGSLSAPPSKTFNYECTPTKTTSSPSSKDLSLSTSPTSSSCSAGGRWAGPAFGNAPHPSTLPLPAFPPVMPNVHTMPTHASSPIPIAVPNQQQYPIFSTSPHHQQQHHHGTSTYLHHQYHPSPPHHHQQPHFLLSPSSPQGHFTSIPAVPFPYVSHIPPVGGAAAPAPPNLMQLSTDLRRMLNINDAHAQVMSDPILVSANSS